MSRASGAEGVECDIDNLCLWVETPLKKQILSRVFRMRDQPIPAPKIPDSPAAGPSPPQDPVVGSEGGNVQAELAALAAQFAAHAGGSFSPEFSASLAREIVLNEIVEQACLATGATGAAIVLARDGEMVCRASSGHTAPELGARLDDKPGVSRECMRTHRVQRCDDAEADPRADIEASRSLGVRSVMVLPLLRQTELVGLLEVFSTEVATFGERDEHTLQVLAQRILKSLEPVPVAVTVKAPPVPLASFAQRSADVRGPSDGPRLAEGAGRVGSGRTIEGLTWALGLAVLVCALLLTVRVSQRLGWLKESARQHPAKGTSAKAGVTGAAPPGESATGDPAGPKSPSASASDITGKSRLSNGAKSSAQPATSHKPSSDDSALSAGGLMVYEDGREVFRMPAAPDGGDSPDQGQGSAVKPASSVEPATRAKLSAATAEDGLTHRVEPEYPEEARRQGIQGEVVLNVNIDPDGAVQEIKWVNGPPLLAQAATDAVKQWRFKPQTANGHRVAMKTMVTLNFRLPR